jgi:hypothetical protein
MLFLVGVGGGQFTYFKCLAAFVFRVFLFFLDGVFVDELA